MHVSATCTHKIEVSVVANFFVHMLQGAVDCLNLISLSLQVYVIQHTQLHAAALELL